MRNLVVCSLCSCYPWPVLGLPPAWYKSDAYRARAVVDPRGVLKAFGEDIPEDVEVRVWDSTAEMRYLVVPERIALQADASFVTPQRPADDRAGPGTNREASAQQRTRPRGSGPAPRSAGSASAEGQRRPAAGVPRQAGPGRSEPTPPKAGNWLPKLGFGVFGSGAAR